MFSLLHASQASIHTRKINGCETELLSITPGSWIYFPVLCREDVKWPRDMDPVFQNFLEGLLQKDPHRRISWPHLLYHPFVKDGTVLSLCGDDGVMWFSVSCRIRYQSFDAVCS